MQQSIRLIGLDLDNTVLNTEKKITPRVREAIAAAIRAGIAVLPVSGRALSGIPREFLEIPGVRYAVCSNGARVYKLPDVLLREDCFSTSAAIFFLRELQKFPCAISVFANGKAYASLVDYAFYEKIFDVHVLKYISATRQHVPDLEEFLLQSAAPVEKIGALFQTQAERQAAWRQLEIGGECTITSSLPGNLELNTPTANKGTALLRLGETLGISQAQIMAIGDGLNDLAMLQAVGYPVAMGNAEPELLQAAKHVTASCDEDGVALAIESILQQASE